MQMETPAAHRVPCDAWDVEDPNAPTYASAGFHLEPSSSPGGDTASPTDSPARAPQPTARPNPASASLTASPGGASHWYTRTPPSDQHTLESKSQSAVPTRAQYRHTSSRSNALRTAASVGPPAAAAAAANGGTAWLRSTSSAETVLTTPTTNSSTTATTIAALASANSRTSISSTTSGSSGDASRKSGGTDHRVPSVFSDVGMSQHGQPTRGSSATWLQTAGAVQEPAGPFLAATRTAAAAAQLDEAADETPRAMAAAAATPPPQPQSSVFNPLANPVTDAFTTAATATIAPYVTIVTTSEADASCQEQATAGAAELSQRQQPATLFAHGGHRPPAVGSSGRFASEGSGAVTGTYLMAGPAATSSGRGGSACSEGGGLGASTAAGGCADGRRDGYDGGQHASSAAPGIGCKSPQMPLQQQQQEEQQCPRRTWGGGGQGALAAGGAAALVAGAATAAVTAVAEAAPAPVPAGLLPGNAAGSVVASGSATVPDAIQLQAALMPHNGTAPVEVAPPAAASLTLASDLSQPNHDTTTDLPPAPPVPSRLQLSASFLSTTPPHPPPAATPAAGVAAAPPADSAAAAAAAAAVGVPVLLMRSGTAAAGAVPNTVMLVGRPPPPGAAVEASAVSQGGAAAGTGAVMVSEALLEDVDVIANISVAAPAAAEAAGVDSRRRTSAAATEGDDGGGGGEGDSGPCSLPAEVRRRLRSHLGRQRMKRIRNWKDLSHCLSALRAGYWLVGTLLLLTAMCCGFMFMAGQFEFLRPADLSSGGIATTLPSEFTDAYSWGPPDLGLWLTFWRPTAARTFTFDYLRVWGGRYGPDLAAGQWWRWVSSLLVHQNSLHLASNMALLLVLSTYLETLYGFWRVLPIWLVSGMAGNMVSAFFESPCTLVVGSSGAVFGLLGGYVADAGLNFESIPLLWLRLLGMAVVVALIVALQVTDHGGSGGPAGTSTSHASHIGGFLTGLLLAVLLLPDFKARRAKKVERMMEGLGLAGHMPEPASPAGRQLFSFWQRHKPLLYGMYAISVVLLLLMLVGVPLYLYLRTFPRMVC